MRRLAFVAGAAFTLAGCNLDLTDLGLCEYTRDFSDEISASGLDGLLADLQDGAVRIEGHSGTNRIRVRAHACANNRRTSQDIDFTLENRGTGARLVSHVPGYDNARLDLVVEVPADFDVDLYDQRGDIELRDLNSVWISDGSGDIDARRIWLDVFVDDDGSGDIYVEDVGGDFTVARKYGAGSIDYRNVNGRVQLP